MIRTKQVYSVYQIAKDRQEAKSRKQEARREKEKAKEKLMNSDGFKNIKTKIDNLKKEIEIKKDECAKLVDELSNFVHSKGMQMDIYSLSVFYDTYEGIPENDINLFRKADELFQIGKKKEGQRVLNKIIKKYKIGE